MEMHRQITQLLSAQQRREFDLAPRAENLPIPKRISDSDFDAICAAFKIPPKERKLLRQMIDGAIAAVTESVTKEKSLPHRRDNRNHIKSAIKALEKVGRQLDSLGPSAQDALSACEFFLTRLVSTRWLQQRFPNDSLAPKIAGLAADFQDYSLDQRERFIRHRSAMVLKAILAEVVNGLNGSLYLLKIGGLGGKRAIDRHVVVFMLVEAWHRIGRKISIGPKSEFVQFVEAVLVSIGWSERGIPDAVADAVKDWRFRHQKRAR
jgi:hypothetical protein